MNKNHPVKNLLRIVCALSLSITAGHTADDLYIESFDSDPGYVSAKGPNNNNISSVAFGAGNAGFPKIETGQYGGTSQYLSGTRIVGSTANGTLQLGSGAPVEGLSRNRSTITFIDTSKAEIGQYEVTFEVSDFQSSDPANTSLYLHIYEGRNSDKGHVKFQLTSQKTLPELASTKPLISTAMGAMNYEVVVNNEISGNGKYSLRFGLPHVGKKGDYVALVWSQIKTRGSAPMPSMTIDEVKVSLLPPVEGKGVSEEAIPPGPFGQSETSESWSLLEDFSDEFNTNTVDPRKWNNNPGSWGAWSWDEANTIQESGKLLLQMAHEPHTRNHTKYFYKSGILRSHRQMTYGYYEARIKGCDLFPGACPAFWIYSDGRQYTGEVRYCEIDFVELQMNELNRTSKKRDPVEHIDMNLHLRLADDKGAVRWVRPGTDPELCANSWVAPWDPRKDFHVYACDVTPEMITWYIDGEEVARSENTYWHLPMNLTLSLGLRHPHIGWVGQNMKPVPGAATGEGFPTTAEVDWVRVWERKE